MTSPLAWWAASRLVAVVASQAYGAASRYLLDEEFLPHEAALAQKLAAPLHDAKFVLDSLDDINLHKPYSLFQGAQRASARMKQLRKMRRAPSVGEESSADPRLLSLWLKEVFGREYNLVMCANSLVEWAWAGSLPEPDVKRAGVENPFLPLGAPKEAVPVPITGRNHSKGRLQAWRFGEGLKYVLLEGSPPSNPCFTDFVYFLFKEGPSRSEPCPLEEVHEGSRALRTWTADGLWKGGVASGDLLPDYMYSFLRLQKDPLKGDVQVQTLAGVGSIGFKRSDVEPFEGQASLYLDRWDAFRRKGLKRASLLYGPPGGGKTTLLHNAALRAGRRVLCLREWDVCDQDRLLDILQGLDLDLIVMEDLDRWDHDTLTSRVMPLLETRPAKMVLATCNNFAKLPQALRRPGRFDELIEIPAPDREGRRAIMLKHARILGVTIPEDAQEQLLTWSEGLTGAFLCEMVARGSVIGWGREDVFPPLDATKLQSFVSPEEEAPGQLKTPRNRAVLGKGRPIDQAESL